MAIADSFMLHKGAERTSLEDVRRAATPQRTDTYVPIPHYLYQDLIRQSLETHGYRILDEFHALTPERERYFGGFEVEPPGYAVQGNVIQTDENFFAKGKSSLVTGFRNGHGKRMSAGFVIGSRMFVCDNLAFSGDITVTRKHSGKILDELPDLVNAGITKIPNTIQKMFGRYDGYKYSPLSETEVDHIIMEAVRRKIIPSTLTIKVWDAYNKPPRDWGDAEVLWNLFNAFTWNLKPKSPQKAIELPRRTLKLHELMDRYIVGGMSKDEKDNAWREQVTNVIEGEAEQVEVA